jgi:L-malate glycosyltransferase
LFKPKNKTHPIKTSYINTRRVAFPIKGWLGKKKYRYGADQHVCISASTRDQLMDAGMHRDKTHLIHDGIILPKAIDPQASRACILELTGFQQHDVIIGSSGNLLPVKRFDWIIHAIACAKKTIPNIKLVIFGEGQQKRSLQEQIQQHQLHDTVVLAGHQENPETCFAGLDVFCMASENEGLCSSLVEAMGRGVPLLGSDTHGIRDVIQQNKNGLLFDANNEQDLCEKLMILASNTTLRKQLSRHSMEDAKKRFDDKQTTAQYMALYSECMKIKK